MIYQPESGKSLQNWLFQDELDNMLPIAGLTHLDQLKILTDNLTDPHALLLIGKAYPGSWDASNFPTEWSRVIPHADSHGNLAELLDTLTLRESYLFKINTLQSYESVQSLFDLEYLCRLTYLTVTRECFQPTQHHHVVPLDILAPPVLEALSYSGRAQVDLQRHQDVKGFGIWRNGVLVSCAFAMRKTEHVYEVCGVYTAPEYRQQGLGAAVVSAATQYILDQNWTPCYGTRDWKLPSLQLAKSLGFWYYQHVGYYLAQRRC